MAAMNVVKIVCLKTQLYVLRTGL